MVWAFIHRAPIEQGPAETEQEVGVALGQGLSTGSWELPGPRPACCTRYVNVSHTEGSARAGHRHKEETVNQRMGTIAKFALGPSLSGGNTETEGEGGTRPKAKDVFSESRAGGMVV